MVRARCWIVDLENCMQRGAEATVGAVIRRGYVRRSRLDRERFLRVIVDMVNGVLYVFGGYVLYFQGRDESYVVCEIMSKHPE